MRLASPRSHVWIALCAAALLAAGCAGVHGDRARPARALLAANDQPGLYLGPEPAAAQIGYIGPNLTLELTGSAVQGRVPVRIDGPLRARGFVAEDQLVLRVQRRGRVRGAPIYVGPGDVVHVLGPDPAPGRLRVRAVPRLTGQPAQAYDGSFPSEGLAASPAPTDARRPDPGVPYRVPAQTALPLFEAPHGALVATLAPQPESYEVRVMGAGDGWLAVRAGDGPYLIGWTEAAALSPAAPVASAAPVGPGLPSVTNAPSPATDTVPARLVEESGELRRVVAGAQLLFGSQVIGVFKRAGWARVLRFYDAGLADVFVAVDDDLALRGLLRTVDLAAPVGAPAAVVAPTLAPAASVSERSTPAATR